MEIILAIVAAFAVIFFGALISLGNERQRRAIDGLREQVVLWALKDLQIKRDKLSQNVKVDNPINWLNNIASKVCGYDLGLQILGLFDEPQSIFCASLDGQHKIIFSSFSPLDIRNLRKSKSNRLERFAEDNPLLSLPKHAASYELSTLNNGILFDLELEIVWKEITGKKLNSINHVWMYMYF